MQEVKRGKGRPKGKQNKNHIDKTHTSIIINTETKKEIEKIAERKNKSFNKVMNDILTSYIEVIK